MERLGLSLRLSLIFAFLLVICGSFSAWVQIRGCISHDLEVVQRISRDLPGQLIHGSPGLLRDGRLDPVAAQRLLDQIALANPSVEAYVLDGRGRIQLGSTPGTSEHDQRVALAPIQALLAGQSLPIEGDDPLTPGGRKIFAAAPLDASRPDAGYLYIVLLGEHYEVLARQVSEDRAARQILYSIGVVGVLGVLCAVFTFNWVTRPMRRLSRRIGQFSGRVEDQAPPAAPPHGARHDEVAVLSRAFEEMAGRIHEQWNELCRQDQQRRELVANISHDLRTPLTSLQGYLETLSIKNDRLSEEERRRYLDTALAQSVKVGRLAQQLFELARLEYGAVKLESERFSLPELVQDVFQKFELAAETRRQRLSADIAPGLPLVQADLGLIERVLTNLLDNAIRHTPPGGHVRVRLWNDNGQVGVQVIDTGDGIPECLRDGLFKRPSALKSDRESGGLGLIFVKRILELHGSDIRLSQPPGQGCVFQFSLAT